MIIKDQITSKLRKERPSLFQKYHLKALGVFGSCVRDDCTEDSDVDILVEFEKPIGIEFIDLATELETILGRRVDLVSRNGIKPKYLDVIIKDLVYV